MMKSISNEKYTISIEDKINDVEVMMSDKMENIDKNIVSYTIHQDNHTIFKIAYTIDDIISMLDSIQLVSHIVLIIMVMLIFLVFKDTLQNIINNEMDELINQIRQLEQMN